MSSNAGTPEATSPRTIVITGASDGIGAAAARKLREQGHRVIVVGRSPEKTKAIAHEIGAEFFVTDFAKLDVVRLLASELDAACERIDVLANNAGGVFGARDRTVDGFEKTFQINHLAPFLLTRLLLPKLVASGASVIQTSSTASKVQAKVVLDDLNLDRSYSVIGAYGTTKLENILFTRELHRRHHTEGLSAAAFHPGVVATSFGKGTTSWLMKFIVSSPLTRPLLTTPDKGAEQLVWLSETAPGRDWVSGTYYEKGKPARRENPQGRDADLARQLWERSEQLLGIG